MINNVTILDLETTGLDLTQNQVIEVGAILYSVKHQTVLQQASTLFPVKENPQEHTNKIKSEATQSCLIPSFGGLQLAITNMIEFSDYLVAHNAVFDSSWLGHNMPIFYFDRPLKWLCTYEDFIFPKNNQKTNLITTALNHGIGVTKAHRALSDCQLIAELFDRTEDLQGLFERAIARSNEPRYVVFAQVSFEKKDLAKSAGFYWNPDGKLWTKELRESDLNIESSQWQFKFTTEIKND